MGHMLQTIEQAQTPAAHAPQAQAQAEAALAAHAQQAAIIGLTTSLLPPVKSNAVMPIVASL
jgi:hypothetical protein